MVKKSDTDKHHSEITHGTDAAESTVITSVNTGEDCVTGEAGAATIGKIILFYFYVQKKFEASIWLLMIWSFCYYAVSVENQGTEIDEGETQLYIPTVHATVIPQVAPTTEGNDKVEEETDDEAVTDLSFGKE